MSLNSFRYQLVYDVRDKDGTLLAHAVEVLPDGATPPEFRLGDPWRVTLPDGTLVQGVVTASLRNLIPDASRNILVQYDFSITRQ